MADINRNHVHFQELCGQQLIQRLPAKSTVLRPLLWVLNGRDLLLCRPYWGLSSDSCLGELSGPDIMIQIGRWINGWVDG